MSSHFAMDPEALQTFLANAFAVQESGVDTSSLAALIEIQNFLTGKDFDLNYGMQLIADRALNVSNASGIAVGLLKSHELVYVAGSGSAAKDIGRRFSAVLSASSHQETRREILKVENAANDPRIEAEICRQFGAMSLLMLPIYQNRALTGVLQVLFEAPHSFREQEIRVYRLMLGALEEGITRSMRPVAKPTPEAVGVTSSSETDSAEYGHSVVGTAHSFIMAAHAVDQATEAVRSATDAFNHQVQLWEAVLRAYLVRIRLQANAAWKTVATSIQRRMNAPSNTELWNAGAAIGVAVVLSIFIWISQIHRSARTDISLPTPATREVQQTPAIPGVASETQKVADSLDSGNMGAYRGFRRVRVGPAEVDYISDDVTIRRFETRPPKAQVHSYAREVKFGNDVTLRYFARPAVVTELPDSSGTRPSETQTHSR
jgi:hypothetical protein